MATKSKEELKQAIMHVFEQQNLRANEIITMRYWYFTFLRSLNSKEQDIFEECVNELIDEDKLIYEENGIESLRLTKLGVGLLCKNSKTIQDIEEDIMDFFRLGNYRVGQGFMARNLGTYIRSLNPIEMALVDDAINYLIESHYISVNGKKDFLFLEKDGYNNIY